MPLVRYFVFASGLLLGLLFVLSWYLPASPAPTVSQDIDRSTIRIHSSPKWPEAVQIDTSVPIVATAPAAPEDAPVVATGPSKTETPAARALPNGVKEAYASDPSPTHKTSAARHHTRLARVASSRKTRRFASHRTPGFASYRAPEWQGWFLASW
jgi:hypothetical protein